MRWVVLSELSNSQELYFHDCFQNIKVTPLFARSSPNCLHLPKLKIKTASWWYSFFE
ncbi:unnamed protein product [Tenebrio molitor]|nr:unnamed protein product [Tenebrio molitor]